MLNVWQGSFSIVNLLDFKHSESGGVLKVTKNITSMLLVSKEQQLCPIAWDD